MLSLSKEVRHFLVREARKLHRKVDPDELVIHLVSEPNDMNPLVVRISTVQNTLNYRYFGAFFRFYNLPITIGDESALVDVLVIIPEAKSNYKITEGLVRFNGLGSYKGNKANVDNFAKKVPRVVAELWNS